MKKQDLKSKEVLFVGWGVENPQDVYMYQIYYTLFKNIFPKLEVFDSKKNYFQFGKNRMNQDFLKIIQSKNYDLIIFAMEYDEFYPETLEKIKELCPKAKSSLMICDDDAKFDAWSRYLSLFFDCALTSQDFVKEYQKDNLTAFFHLDYNSYKLSPLKIKKIYDVTFIGRPKADRNEVIKYLLNNGVKITLFGWGWHMYPEFAGACKGPLSPEDYAKVINQSKINLSPAKAGYAEQKDQYNLKARYFEVALCKSFQLMEKFPTLLKFFNEKEMGMYTTQEEMLEKIKYYLSHEKEREKMAERAYEKTIKKYDREKELKSIFTKIFNSNKENIWRETNQKVVTLTEDDFSSNLKEKLKDFDYVMFKNKNLRYISKLKRDILLRAIFVTGNPISCCDYYVSPVGLKDYMVFSSKFSFKRIGREANQLIDANQLMVKKDFFLENEELFKFLIKGKPINLINEENTAFVSVPLVSVKNNRKIEYEKIKKAFEMRFQNHLLSLIHQKKLLTSSYPYFLTFKSLRNRFIFKFMQETIQDKNSQEKLSVNKIYFSNSPINRLKNIFYKNKQD
jgi:hypothetical protein